MVLDPEEDGVSGQLGHAVALAEVDLQLLVGAPQQRRGIGAAPYAIPSSEANSGRAPGCASRWSNRLDSMVAASVVFVT